MVYLQKKFAGLLCVQPLVFISEKQISCSIEFSLSVATERIKNQRNQLEKGSVKMRHSLSAAVLFVSTAILLICSQGLFASEPGQSASLVVAAPGVEKTVQDELASLVEVQEYNRSIHIMAMLLVGFGFLMIFLVWISYFVLIRAGG